MKYKPGVTYIMNEHGKWMAKVPKPVNTDKWKLINGVWQYKLNGNWAEVADHSTDDYWHEAVLFINGKQFKDNGWHSLEDFMRYAEWQIEHPNGIEMGWWSLAWRLSVLALLLFICFSWPLYSFLAYCVLSYSIMGYELLSGQLSTVGTPRQQIVSGIILWLFSPIAFAFLIIFFSIRPPIL